MKRISSLIACGVIALGFATSSNAQLRGSALIITNSNGTAKFNMTGSEKGIVIDQRLTLCRPGSTTDMVTLVAPAGNGAMSFDFPDEGGTLLTTNSLIDASQITNLNTGGITSVAAGDLSLNISTLAGAVTASLNTANPNNWTGVQYLPANLAQGNNLIAAINFAGTDPLTNYVTNNTFNTTITDIQTDITNLTTLTSNHLEAGDLAVTSPITLTGTTFGMENSGVTAGTYTNANITVDAFGRVTAAANGSGSVGNNVQLTPATVSGAGNNNNNDLTVGTGRYFRLSGVTDYGYRSLTTGQDGQMVILYNNSANNMTLSNDFTGIPSGHSKILTNLPTVGGNSDNLTTTGPGSAILIYDATVDAWVVTSFMP